MDKSKEYIKMCDCEEVRSFAKYKVGDYVASFSERFVRIDKDTLKAERLYEGTFILGVNNCGINRRDLSVWLPRQDQLQEILVDPDIDLITQELICEFDAFILNWGDYPFKSMEQVWLTLVMSKKYHKTWNGEEWIETN